MALRVNNNLSYDRESTPFMIPVVMVYGNDDWAIVNRPYQLDVDYTRESYSYTANDDGTPMSESAAKALALSLKSSLTKSFTILSVTQTSPDATPVITQTTTSKLCAEIEAVRNGTSSNWTVEVKEYTPVYSIIPLLGNP